MARIRKALRTDCDAMLAIESSCFQTDLISKRQMRYILSKAKASNLLVEEKGQVVACSVCFLPKLPRPARLYSIAVLPEKQGKGFAQQLLAELFNELNTKKYRRCVLEVRASHQATHRLYYQFGFSDIARIENYYEDGEAAIKMAAYAPFQKFVQKRGKF